MKTQIDANLRGVDLSGVDPSGVDLSGVDLSGVDLSGAKIDAIAAARLSIVPESGDFVGWKKCRNGIIVKLKIPAATARSNATGRKCRAEFVEVLEIVGAEEGVSIHDDVITYRVGETVRCHEWNPDRWVECGDGIHFYITRAEAEAHA